MFEKPPQPPKAETAIKLSREQQERILEEAYELTEDIIREVTSPYESLGAEATMAIMKVSQSWREHHLRKLGISEAVEEAYIKKHEQD